MTTATVILNPGTGGAAPLVDTLTTVDGIAAPANAVVQIIKNAFGAANTSTSVTTATPLPVTLPAGKNKVTVDDTQADIHGQLIGVTRITQITTKFFQQAPSNFLNVTVSGGATATGPTLGAGVFSTSTAVTASLLAQTPTGILYAAQYEAWAVMSGAYTAPTSAASFQRLGIYDAVNGYSIGYNGLTFGLWVRVNSVDTFIAQSAWNKDTLAGAVTSLFTNNGNPVALAPTNLNMYRFRYGWYGGVSAFFEVYAPDGNWVVVHQVRTVNAQVGVNMTVPDLPMSLELNKNASDATNLSIFCGGWAAGITAPASGPLLSGQKSIAALNAVVNVPLAGLGEVSFSITGTWVGTLAFQHSLDGLIWNSDAPLSGIPSAFVTSTTTNGIFTAAIASSRVYRVIATAWTSGSANIIYSGSPEANLMVAQSLITDGNNNGPVTVKPAATAAVSGDAALVVALHPSSLAAVQAVNQAQINGIVNLTGNGISGTGSQRVNIASDNTAFAVNSTLTAETTKVIGTVNIAAAQTLATVSAVTAITNALPTGANSIGAVTNTNLDVLLSTRLKAADTLTAVTTVTTVSAVTAITNALPAGANSIGTVQVATPTAFSLSSAATTNATSVKATAGTVFQIVASNVGAAAAFLKIFNLATAPTVGTSVPFLTIPIPASGVVSVPFGTLGMRFGTGIALSITNLVADADATVIVAAQVKVAISYV